MQYADELGSGAMIYITKFHEDLFKHSEVNKGRVNPQTHTEHGDR
jgi:hypothetical protein